MLDDSEDEDEENYHERQFLNFRDDKIPDILTAAIEKDNVNLIMEVMDTCGYSPLGPLDWETSPAAPEGNTILEMVRTPLWAAASNNQEAVVRYLLEKNAHLGTPGELNTCEISDISSHDRGPALAKTIFDSSGCSIDLDTNSKNCLPLKCAFSSIMLLPWEMKALSKPLLIG